MTKYTLREGNNGEMILEINGVMSRCPFTPPLVLPDHISQSMRVTMIPCSTICPHAYIDDAAIGGSHYVVCCGHAKNFFNIEETYKKPTVPVIGL